MADPVIVQQVHDTNNVNFGRLDFTETLTATVAGNLLVAVCAVYSQFSPLNAGHHFTAPAGWVAGPETNGDTVGYQIAMFYYPNNPGGITSVHFTDNQATGWNNETSSIWIAEIGNMLASPLDKSGSTLAGSATAATVTTGATDTLDKDFVLAGFVIGNGANNTWAAGSGYTQQTTSATDNHGYFVVETCLGATPAAQQTATGTWGTASGYAAVIMTFRGTSGSSGGGGGSTLVGLVPPVVPLGNLVVRRESSLVL